MCVYKVCEHLKQLTIFECNVIIYREVNKIGKILFTNS